MKCPVYRKQYLHTVPRKQSISLPKKAFGIYDQRAKQDDKPGYVVNDHLSRTIVANSLQRHT